VGFKINGFETLADARRTRSHYAFQKKEGPPMTMHSSAKKALARAKVSLDSVIGKIFGDEQLESDLVISRGEANVDIAPAQGIRFDGGGHSVPS
jgi:hypothetical protein